MAPTDSLRGATDLTRRHGAGEGGHDDQEVAMGNAPTEPQFKALEVFKLLIADAEGRRDYTTADGTEAKEEVFNRRRDREEDEERSDLRDANYRDIAEPALSLLESLSDSELALLSDLDAAFVEAGLFADRNPVPLMVH
jgi:hypothetical protein